jgi:molybdate transport system substrate-binding protein
MTFPPKLSHSIAVLSAVVACMLPFSAMSADQKLQVAAAADLAACITTLDEAFAKSVGGADIKASIGSSGNFFAQIKNGAPFDVFLSADTRYPGELAKAGLADPATLTVYAHGQLMLWTNDTHLSLDKGLALLSDPKITRIAIANPDLAPYGRAAKAVLERAGLWDTLKPKLVIGENIAQTAQFVETGNAQVGFVGFAHIKAHPSGVSWKIPAELYPLIEQGGIVTAKGATNPLAPRYLQFLRSEAGKAILLQYGFALPPEPSR